MSARILLADKTLMTDVVIDKRFCGPKTSANGGYAAGVFAQGIKGAASVTLKIPPPLNTPIERRPNTAGGDDAVFEGRVIAVATPADVTISLPPIPDDNDIKHAHDAFLSDANDEHILPYCFVCGIHRAHGDGLRLFTGPAPGSVVNADFWAPAAEFAADDGLVREEILWAALDCPSAFALRLWPRLTLLGRLSAEIKRRPRPGERLIAAAWPERSDGRKHFSSSVLLDENREVVAAANATWIEIDDPVMLQKLKDENS